jgi:hypothetical protein
MSSGPTWRETMDRLAANQWPSLREIRKISGGTEIRASMHYRVSTNFNWYVRPIAAFLVGNFEQTALTFYARRAAAAHEQT